ncbi:MAG: hypothetical protein KC503_15275 [Myxococcales bacterium]|nr:hypothetical protein [Myxococcales bacterium]
MSLPAKASLITFTAFALVAGPLVQTARATPGPGVVRTAAGCRGRIVRRPKRMRCVACVARGGHFHKAGARIGFCHIRPVHGVVYTVPGCRRRALRVGKRRRCAVCVRAGGLFHLMGVRPGYCNPRR